LKVVLAEDSVQLSLAKHAKHVYTAEIDKARMDEAKQNAQIAGVKEKITFINIEEFSKLSAHECESLYLYDKHELFCLYFGRLAKIIGRSEYRI